MKRDDGAAPKKRTPWGTELSNGLSVLAFGAILLSVWAQGVVHFGWVLGSLIGWFVAPIAAVAGSMLVLLWTVPMRGPDQLSLRRRRQRDQSRPVDLGSRPRTISVVMPVFNAAHYMVHSLPPLMAMLARGELAEVIVVDDGATDASAEYARSLGATVLSSGGRKGPGAARNIAAQQATGDILWFIDADVVAHPECASMIRKGFVKADVVAVFGSYDDKPSAPNFGSQYKNLVHHHYHQHADPNASTFWSGCGAVDRRVFLEIGGFDAERYRQPSIEDVDLGYRLRAAGGAIALERRLLSTHLKRWSVPELVKTDIFRRALPWARLMLRESDVLDDLNVSTFERLRAGLAGVTVLMTACALVGAVSPWWLVPLLFTVLTANWELFRLFSRSRGVFFAIFALAFHQIYYLYSAATFVWCWVEARILRRGAPAPLTEAPRLTESPANDAQVRSPAAAPTAPSPATTHS